MRERLSRRERQLLDEIAMIQPDTGEEPYVVPGLPPCYGLQVIAKVYGVRIDSAHALRRTLIFQAPRLRFSRSHLPVDEVSSKRGYVRTTAPTRRDTGGFPFPWRYSTIGTALCSVSSTLIALDALYVRNRHRLRGSGEQSDLPKSFFHGFLGPGRSPDARSTTCPAPGENRPSPEETLGCRFTFGRPLGQEAAP